MDTKKQTKIFPDDIKWKENSYLNFHKSNKELDEFTENIDKKKALNLNVIDNIYCITSIGIFFSMKILGYDQFVKRYASNKITEKETILCSSILGCSNFIDFPRGMIVSLRKKL